MLYVRYTRCRHPRYRWYAAGNILFTGYIGGYIISSIHALHIVYRVYTESRVHMVTVYTGYTCGMVHGRFKVYIRGTYDVHVVHRGQAREGIHDILYRVYRMYKVYRIYVGHTGDTRDTGHIGMQ